jgi:signal transduction histidine kinase/CheY-like chemotaxis protein
MGAMTTDGEPSGTPVGDALRALATFALEDGDGRELLGRALTTLAAFPWSRPARLLSAYLLDADAGAPRLVAQVGDPAGAGPPLVLELAAPGRRLGELRVALEPGGAVSGPERAFLEAAAAVLAGGLLRRRVVGEQRRLETAFLQAQRMEAVGRLAGGVAHDFNNILTTITNYADLGLMKLPAGAPLCRNFEEILASVERATLLTQQLLAFSRRQVVEPRLLDLDAILAEMGKMLRRLLGADVDLRVQAGAGAARVFADPALIEQAVINLALGARDAMPRGGTLVIETASAGAAGADPGTVRLTVSDSGAGDASPAADRDAQPGAGLGLAAVAEIVRQSGGALRVQVDPGGGSSVHVTFPAAPAADPSGAQPALPGLPRGSETILLAEDDDSVRVVVGEVLRDLGYRVLEAREGRAALTLAETHPGPIDLLLSDVVMPGMSGTELHRRLAARRPGLRALMISGYSDDSVSRHGAAAADVEFIQKPFSPWALATRLRGLLDAAPKP